MNESFIHRFLEIVWREMRLMTSRPLYIAMLVFVPAFFTFFFLSLMDSGTPKGLPVAVVDQDNSTSSRNVVRTLDAMKNNDVMIHAKDFYEARKLMQTGEVYGIYLIPESFERDLQSSRQPTVSFYTNNAYLIPGSLLMSDMKTTSVLTKAAVAQSTMKAKGYSDEIVMAMLQPITVDTYTIGNPSSNYIVYMCNVLVPGLIDIIFMLMVIFVLGKEVKDGTSRELLETSGDNILLAVTAKLAPLTIIGMICTAAIDVVMYKYLQVPCKCGLTMWVIITWIYMLSTEALAVFMYALFPQMRMSLSIASIWSVLSVSMSGLTFPVSAMPGVLQGWSYLFPLRHFHLLYVDLGLNGSTLYYCWPNLVALLIFLLLPTIVLGGGGIKRIYEEMKYKA